METYSVRLTSVPEGHSVPALLQELGDFVAEQPHGTLGWFDALVAEPIPEAWNADAAERLRSNAFVFMQLPDGSLLALVNRANTAPPAVALLGSEGEARTIADSLEEFLVRLSKSETQISELDDDDAKAGRKALASWLRARKVKVPKTTPFDFAAWLDGDGAPAIVEPRRTREQSPITAQLGPRVSALAAIIGRRGDDPEVVRYVTEVLKKKVPASTTDANDSQNVSAPKAGVELVFSHDVLNDDYPPIPKTAKSFIPYVTYAWVYEKIGEDVVGVSWTAKDIDAIANVLGEPKWQSRFTTEDEPSVAVWTRDLGGGVQLNLSFAKKLGVTISVASARDLARSTSVRGALFLAWAAAKGLLDETRFSRHAELLRAVKERRATGAELMATALPRGLWDDHLKDLPKLRITAYRWFHNLAGIYIEHDLKKVLGDDLSGLTATWDAVDRVAPAFEERFGRFLVEG